MHIETCVTLSISLLRITEQWVEEIVTTEQKDKWRQLKENQRLKKYIQECGMPATVIPMNGKKNLPVAWRH